MLPFEFFSLNFEGDKIVPLAVFLRGNFNCSAGLAQWCGLAQTLAFRKQDSHHSKNKHFLKFFCVNQLYFQL